MESKTILSLDDEALLAILESCESIGLHGENVNGGGLRAGKSDIVALGLLAVGELWRRGLLQASDAIRSRPVDVAVDEKLTDIIVTQSSPQGIPIDNASFHLAPSPSRQGTVYANVKDDPPEAEFRVGDHSIPIIRYDWTSGPLEKDVAYVIVDRELFLGLIDKATDCGFWVPENWMSANA